MKPINYKSDFDFVLELKDCDGHDIMWPQSRNWNITFCSGMRCNNTYRIGVTDGEAYGCYEDGGRIHVVMSSHGLGAGVLRGEIRIDEANAHYPGGMKHPVHDFVTDLELTAVGCFCGEGGTLAAVAMLPVTTVELFGATVDEINAQLTGILKENGGGGIAATQPGFVPEAVAPDMPLAYVRRGMMPINAMQGVAYNNIGYIKVGTVEAGQTKVFDISDVDERIEGVECQNRKIAFNYSIDGDNRTLIVQAEDKKIHVRLAIRAGGYVMRCVDGKIRRFGTHKGVGITSAEAYVAPVRLSRSYPIDGKFEQLVMCLRAMHLEQGGNSLEFQMKRGRYRTRYDGERYKRQPGGIKKSVWGKPRWSVTRGVARVRAIGSRGLRGEWTVFTFRACEDTIHVRQLT